MLQLMDETLTEIRRLLPFKEAVDVLREAGEFADALLGPTHHEFGRARPLLPLVMSNCAARGGVPGRGEATQLANQHACWHIPRAGASTSPM